MGVERADTSRKGLFPSARALVPRFSDVRMLVVTLMVVVRRERGGYSGRGEKTSGTAEGKRALMRASTWVAIFARARKRWCLIGDGEVVG